MIIHNPKNTIENAVWYAEQDKALYPVNPGNKRPLIKGWNRGAAVTNPDAAARMFGVDFTNALIGVATGPSDLIVLDVDRRNDGDKSFKKLVDKVGLETFECVPTADSPDGFHIYFAAPKTIIRPKPGALGRGIDIDTKKGTIVPTSLHSEATYRWRDENGWPEKFDAPPVPSELERLLRAASAEQVRAAMQASAIPNHTRNDTLMRYASRLRWRFGFTEEMLADALLVVNRERCQPPLTEKEVLTIVQSIAKRAIAPVDPTVWFHGWLPVLSARELRVAAIYRDLAESVYGLDLTPAEVIMLKQTGLPFQHFYPARNRLENRRAIRVHSRGENQAARIELIPRPESPD
jgi:hypothetical protein